MPLPSLSPEQRAAALEKAAEIRKARAELKDQLKSGKTTLAAVLDRAEGCLLYTSPSPRDRQKSRMPSSA